MPAASTPSGRPVGRGVVAAIVALALLVFAIGRLTATRGPEGDAAGDSPDREARPPAPDDERAPGLAVPARGIGSPDGTAVADAAAEATRGVTGRVVDETRAPVAAAIVSLCDGGTVVAGTAADTDGRFQLVAPPWGLPPRLVVRAAHGDAVAVTRVRFDLVRRAAADLGDVVLRPAAPLVVRVTDGGAGVAGATVFVAAERPHDATLLDGPDDGGGAGAWVASGTTGVEGHVTFAGLPRGDVHVLALATGPRRGVAWAAFDAPGTVEVALVPARDVEVTVVEEAGGRPVVGVRLGVETTLDGVHPDRRLGDPADPAPTDAAGRTVLRAVSREPLTVTVVGEGWVWPPWRTAVPLASGATTLRIEVPQATAAAVLAATFRDGPPPPDGTPVRLDVDPDEDRGFWGPAGLPVREGRIADGALRIDGLRNPQVRGRAWLPDGRVARFAVDPHLGDERPQFARPRSVAVNVRDEDDGAADGVVAVVNDARGRELARGTTGADGRWIVSDLPPSRVTVTVEAGAGLVEPARHGVFEDELRQEVDLEGGDGAAAFVRPAFVEAELVATTDGAPGLPPGASVRVGLAPASLAFADPPGARWDVANGTVRFRVRRPTGRRTLVVLARAPGFSTGYETFRSDPDSRHLRASIAFSSAASLLVTLPTSPDADAQRFVERLGEDGAWGPVWTTPRPSGPASEATRRLADVVPGTYRLRHEASGATSPVVVLRAGEQGELALSLDRVGVVDVLVELPDGIDVEGLSIHRTGPGLAWVVRGRGDPFWAVGTVRGLAQVRWTLPGDRPVRLWAEHPACVTTPGEGDVTVTAPGPRVRLRLRAR